MSVYQWLLFCRIEEEEEEEDDTSMNTQSEVSLEGVRVVEAGEQVTPGNKGGGGAAKTGEGEVAQRRASLPLEVRQSEFKEMLLERGVRVGGLRVRVVGEGEGGSIEVEGGGGLKSEFHKGGGDRG